MSVETEQSEQEEEAGEERQAGQTQAQARASNGKAKVDVKKLAKACKEVGRLLCDISEELSKHDSKSILSAPSSSKKGAGASAKTKVTRAPSKYNIYIQNRLPQLKQEMPELTQRERFKQAATEWKDSDDNPKKAAPSAPDAAQTSDQAHGSKRARGDDGDTGDGQRKRNQRFAEGTDTSTAAATAAGNSGGEVQSQQPEANGGNVHDESGEERRKKKKKKKSKEKHRDSQHNEARST